MEEGLVPELEDLVGLSFPQVVSGISARKISMAEARRKRGVPLLAEGT